MGGEAAATRMVPGRRDPPGGAMTRRLILATSAVAVAASLGYAAVAAQSKPAAGLPSVSVFKSPT